MRPLAAGVLMLVVLAGCTPDGGASAPSPGTVTTTRADGTSGEPDEDGTADAGGDTTAAPEVVRVPVGPATVEIAAPALVSTAADGGAPAAAVSAGDEGASNVALVLTDAPALVSVEAGSLVRHPDGTLTVLDDAGTPVGGLDAPRVVGPHGEDRAEGTAGADGTDDEASAGPTAAGAPGVRVVLLDAHRAEVTLVPAAGTSSGTSPDTSSGPDGTSGAPRTLAGDASGTGTADDAGATGAGPAAAWDVVVTLGTQAVRSADWGEREGGRSLAVDATAWARAAGRAGQELVWAQVLAAEPEADTPTMHDQLVCHAVGAPDKATWNLEPWRPDVGLLATMAARCNPT
ncbi:hypothetical protein JOE63_000944 [Cellulosimicrobium cellulans]|uniref:DUF2599 domain-containing protein n=1 Tax=Cellulosimicrobium cellulans TaxID=1710 RepID=UPI0027DEA664|nr:DUF2599 domain-containing protein [Cellulosimicrobium cellulans]MBM7818467.1 hypothetical protein [Cellulosimicrobium cellulans]